MQLSLGFSPCPNDTFIFDAMVNGRVDHPFEFDVILEDVEQLNLKAFEKQLDITKLSFHAWTYLMDSYQMLNSGAALGFGVGPLLISKGPLSQTELDAGKIAIPGKWTTANFLMTHAFPNAQQKAEMLFSDIEKAVLDGEYAAGVIIHENRFTYHERGLHLLADLGKVWENKTGMAIPLGGIAIKRSIPTSTKKEIEALIRSSIQYATQHPAESLSFIHDHAQEMDPKIMQKHIDLYVNEYSLDLQDEGRKAINHMLTVMLSNNLIHSVPDQPIL